MCTYFSSCWVQWIVWTLEYTLSNVRSAWNESVRQPDNASSGCHYSLLHIAQHRVGQILPVDAITGVCGHEPMTPRCGCAKVGTSDSCSLSKFWDTDCWLAASWFLFKLSSYHWVCKYGNISLRKYTEIFAIVFKYDHLLGISVRMRIRGLMGWAHVRMRIRGLMGWPHGPRRPGGLLVDDWVLGKDLRWLGIWFYKP